MFLPQTFYFFTQALRFAYVSRSRSSYFVTWSPDFHPRFYEKRREAWTEIGNMNNGSFLGTWTIGLFASKELSFFYHWSAEIWYRRRVSLRSKRFHRFFCPFEARKLGRAQHALLALFCGRSNFRAFQKLKMLQTCGKPYGNACYAGYRRVVSVLIWRSFFGKACFPDSQPLFVLLSQLEILLFLRDATIRRLWSTSYQQWRTSTC